jgi:hypothetical protein
VARASAVSRSCFSLCVDCFFRLLKQYNASNRAMITTRATPKPIPALAPVVRPPFEATSVAVWIGFDWLEVIENGAEALVAALSRLVVEPIVVVDVDKLLVTTDITVAVVIKVAL